MSFVFHSTKAQLNLRTDMLNRKTVSLDNKWQYIFDPYKTDSMIIAIKRWLKIIHQPIGITISQKIKLTSKNTVIVINALEKDRKSMKKIGLTLFGYFFLGSIIVAQKNTLPYTRKNIPLDSIYLSDPFIMADKKTNMYYMTGTSGLLWKSKDLKLWEGPFRVAETDSTSWMGPHPMIWAAEIHPYKGKYYYFATFTNRAVTIDTVKGNTINRRPAMFWLATNLMALLFQ